MFPFFSLPEGFNAARLALLTRLPWWVLAFSAALLLVSLWWHWQSTQGAPRRVRWGLLGLRLGAVAALFVLICEPGIRLLAKSRIANRVVVALDRSASMGGEHQDRIRAGAKAALEVTERLAQSGDPYVVDELAFADDVQPIQSQTLQRWAGGDSAGAQDPNALAVDGQGTRLIAPLMQVASSEDGSPLSAVVLITDGADTTALPQNLDGSMRREIARLGVPIHTVLTDSARSFRDIALERVVTDDFAFVRNTVKVQVVVRHKGFAGQEIPLTLREDGKPIKVSRTVLDSAEGQVEVNFTFRPLRAGKRLYTVSAPVAAGEAIAENNRIDFTLKVIRDRIRVLQVAGRPSWDERFLRQLLKENPSVDLISFFILRTPADNAGARPAELSLIPFPTRELFTEELHSFDVVIFQDFDFMPYQMETYLRYVKDFVEDAGGGFMMIGGAHAFSDGDYANTPVGDILPVTLLPGRGHLNQESFTPLITAAGRSHPITDLGASLTQGNSLDRLLPLEGLNLVAGLAPESQALLSHPFLNDQSGKAHPVVAVREVGRGRSLAVLTDSSWMWSLPQASRGGRPDVHRRFFANALRWLIRDPELSRVKLQVARRSFEPGAEAALEVRSYDDKYRPLPDAEIDITLAPMDPGSTSTPLTEKGRTGADGAWRVGMVPPGAGAYRVTARATASGQVLGTASDVVIVRGARDEILHAEPRPDLLKAIAKQSGGRFVKADQIDDLDFADLGKERIHRQRSVPIWDRHWSIFLLLIFAGGEWYWRRRRGFA
jgi:uncharacterized membrane protein